MVKIASRSSWGARYADGDKTLTGLAGEVFLHHSVTAQLSAKATVAEERAHMRNLESIGKNRGFPGISYNVVVFPSGRAYQGVSWNRRGTHTGGRNSTSRSICFAGNYETNQPTPAQLATAAAIFQHGKGRWWTTSAPLRGHRDVKSTACPGRHVYQRRTELAQASAASSTTASSTATAKALAKLTVDGVWGKATTTRLQQVLGMKTIDGVVSSQGAVWRGRNRGLTSGWEWVNNPKGSPTIREWQRRIGMVAKACDGKLGPQTVRSAQRFYRTPVTGKIGRPSVLVKALQKRLNDGKV
jgi:hypothetical protein